jgi:translation initiation factor IF-2
MRAYEAAKKYKLTNEELIRLLGEAGFPIKSHMSGVTDEMLAVVENQRGAVKTKTKAKPKSAAKKKTPAKTKTAKKVETAEKPAAKKKAKTAVKTKATPKTTKPKPPTRAEKTQVARPTAEKTPVARPTAREADRKPTRRAHPPRRREDRPKPPTKKPPPGRPGRRAGKPSKTEAQQKAVRESVRRTLAKIETTRRTRRRKGKPREITTTDEPPVRISEGSTIDELAAVLKVDPEEIIQRCEDLGVSAAANQSLDKDTLELLTDDFAKKVQIVSDEIEELLKADVQVEPSRLEARSPIVTVMGHVDHGKTSILDYIRKTRVASGEAGGITQHIGAYQVAAPGGAVTFIDTPGHEAFTSMRARGAQVTDVVVLVVAADDGVMPQTVEAINHAKAAGVPIIVAINKMDLPNANPTQIRQQLTERDVVVEDFGGDVVSVEVSAKTGDGIDKLLEMILLQAELMELQADAGASAQAVAVEVRKEEGRGILCTALILQGTLRVGDAFVVGSNYGKVRALLDERGRGLTSAGPSTPVLLLGCNDLPEAGDRLVVVRGEREARELGAARRQKLKDREQTTTRKLTLEELYAQIQSGDLKELRLLVKGDTNGSVEALTQSLEKLTLEEEVVVKVLHSGVGVVGESDVLLAASSNAIIIGFNVKISPKAQGAAEREKVEIKLYKVIYEVIQDVDDAMKGLLEPEQVERVLGRAEVRKVFKISRLGQIAGSFVIDGSITRNSMVRVLREDDVVYEGKISSLKRFQDDVREVQKDFECGIGVSGFGDLREGDIVEAFIVEEKARVF